MILENLKKGSILSETSFFVVEEIGDSGIEAIDDLGNKVSIGKEYVEDILNSADQFDREEAKTMTELAEILINSPRIAMTVSFYKKDVEKTKKVYEAEKQSRFEEIQNAKVSDVPTLLNALVENPILKTIPGELRVMKGRHYGNMDDLGRIQFVDMEQEKKSGLDYDSRLRQIDPRTVQWLVVNNVKYFLK